MKLSQHEKKVEYLEFLICKIIPHFEAYDIKLSEIKNDLRIYFGNTKRWEGLYYSKKNKLNLTGLHEIRISEKLQDPFDIACVLIHELCHAMQYHLYGDGTRDHGIEFTNIAMKVGLDGHMPATYPNEELTKIIKNWIGEIYPNIFAIKTCQKLLSFTLYSLHIMTISFASFYLTLLISRVLID